MLVKAPNLPQAFFARVDSTPHKTAMLRKRGGQWNALTWKQVEEKVFSYALALKASGIRSGDRVAIMAATCPEWTFADLAVLSLGAITVPIYASVTEEDVYEILANSGARAIVTENAKHVEKVRTVSGRLEALQLVYTLSNHVDDTVVRLDSAAKAEIAGLEEKGSAAYDASKVAWRATSVAIESGTLASIVYTSGTQGKPKGVCLSHANFLGSIANTAEALGLCETDTLLFFLPAAHIMGRIEQMASFCVGLTLGYAENLNTLTDNLFEVRPTILVSVPRVFEKFYTTIKSRARARGAVNAFAFDRAVDVATRLRRPDVALPLGLLRQGMDFVFFRKLREKFGGRIRFCVSGGAALSPEIAAFFHAAGIQILEGYGLTETTGPIFANRPEAFAFGSVGHPLKNVEHRFADDGELQVRGPMVFSGYFKDDALTREVLSPDGWFSTGDIVSVDAKGFFRITDRKKDILVTAGGKNIAPQKIENLFKEDPLFSHVLVTGDGRKFLSALLTLNPGEAKRLALEFDIPFENYGDTVANPSFVSLVKERVDRVNRQLASYETIKRFKVLARDFSTEAGELTPSMKIRRRFCFEKYKTVIEQFYENDV